MNEDVRTVLLCYSSDDEYFFRDVDVEFPGSK